MLLLFTGFDLDKNEVFGLLCKRERNYINLSVMIPVVSFNNAIPCLQKVGCGQIFTPLTKNISLSVRQIP